MGVKGLTSYINRNSERFYKSYELCDCTLVIDGCSLACQLYVLNCVSAFGGDYDKFATTIRNFFLLLRHSNVIPVVIIDGGYETRKLSTILSRQAETYRRVTQCTRLPVFPLMMMEVFKQTLKKLKVKFAQADFEGDPEIAAVARYLDCPVLSLDSDFFLYDVKYIPFSTLSLSLSQKESNGHSKNYLSCKIYDATHFLANFKGLDKSLLPLLAVLGGNDFVPRSDFAHVARRGMPSNSRKKPSNQQSRIHTAFDLLRGESVSSAIQKILNHTKKGKRKYIQDVIKTTLDGYNLCPSDLISFLDLKVPEGDSSVSDKPQELPYTKEPISECNFPEELGNSNEESEEESDCSEDENEDDEDRGDNYYENTEEETVCPVPNSSNFPNSLRERFRRGELPSFVSDIYHLHYFFCKAQVEDLSLDDSHTLCFPILQVICGFLFYYSKRSKSHDSLWHITCFLRDPHKNIQKFVLEAAGELPCLAAIPTIESLSSVPVSVRKNILYNSLRITSLDDIEILESFGEEWHLFAMSVVFWARSVDYPKLTNCHLHALIISMIALGIVDKKVGLLRSKRRSKKKSRIQQTCSKTDSEQREGKCLKTTLNSDAPNVNSKRALKEVLSEVSEADCVNLLEFLSQCHQVNQKLLANPRKFSFRLVHSFAQLQTCLHQTMALNSVLEYPVRQCRVSEVYSGTIIYNAFSNFNGRSNVEGYIKTIMSNSLSVYAVYKAVWDQFVALLPNLQVLFRKAKTRNRVKPRKCVDSSADDSIVDNEESEPMIDANNRFSVLGLA